MQRAAMADRQCDLELGVDRGTSSTRTPATCPIQQRAIERRARRREGGHPYRWGDTHTHRKAMPVESEDAGEGVRGSEAMSE